MEGHFSTDQSPQWAVVPIEEEYLNIRDLICCLSILKDIQNFVKLTIRYELVF